MGKNSAQLAPNVSCPRVIIRFQYIPVASLLATSEHEAERLHLGMELL